MKKSIFNRWAKVTAALAAGAILSSSAVFAAGPTTPATQKSFLLLLVQLTDSGSSIPTNPTGADLANWASGVGLNPAGGWMPDADLTSGVVAEALCQLFRIDPGGKDYEQALINSGVIKLKGITRPALVFMLDDSEFKLKINEFANCTKKDPSGKDPKNPNGGGNAGNSGGGKK